MHHLVTSSAYLVALGDFQIFPVVYGDFQWYFSVMVHGVVMNLGDL